MNQFKCKLDHSGPIHINPDMKPNRPSFRPHDTVPNSDPEIRGGGESGHSDSEIRRGGGGLQNVFFQFSLKIMGGAPLGPSPGSATAREGESRHAAPSLGAQSTTFLSDASQTGVDFFHSWAKVLPNLSGKLSVQE